MMPLQDLHVETQLNEQIGTYLAQPITYADLRSKCLSNAAISPIVDPIVERLNATAEHEKAEKENLLTTHALRVQRDQDVAEHRSDQETQAKAQRKEGLLESNLTAYEPQLSMLRGQLHQMETVDLPIIKQKLKQRLDEIHDLTLLNPQLQVVVDHPTAHIGTKDHASHHHGNRRITTHSALETLQKLTAQADLLTEERNDKVSNIKRIQHNISFVCAKISGDKLELQKVRGELRSLTERKNARDERSRNRTLSSENEQRLSQKIQENNRRIDGICARMKTETQMDCHAAFLTQLAHQLDGLPLEWNEKCALTQLITSMQEHKQDLTALQTEQSTLQSDRWALQALEQQHASNNERYPALQKEKAELLGANDTLGAQLCITQGQQETFEAQRNAYAQYALITTIVAGLGAISGYFLIQSGVIAVAPIVPMIMAGVVGAALVTLLGIAGVAGIRALLRQSEATTQNNTLTANATRMADIDMALRNIGTQAPQLMTDIKTSKQRVAEQERTVDVAERKAAASLASAQKITLATAEQRTISSNPLILFRAPSVPSAPPTPLTNEIPHAQDTPIR